MNETELENRLRQAPRPTPPAGLLARLQADVPPAPRRENRPGTRPETPGWGRWFPTLAFGSVVLGGILALGAEAAQLARLRAENEALRARLDAARAVAAAPAEAPLHSLQDEELARWRANAAEAARLRGATAELKDRLTNLPGLQAENQKLRAARAATVQAVTDTDLGAAAREQANRVICVNNLKQIGLAFRIWANDHNGRIARDFLSLTNELGNTPRILHCPSDSTPQLQSWDEVAAGRSSYQLPAAGRPQPDPAAGAGNAWDASPEEVLVICPHHHNVGLADGSVQSLSAAQFVRSIQVVNGRTIMVQ